MGPNDTIGRYQIIREIDRGGMATVYLAYDTKMSREVALKVLPQQFAYDKTFLLRFQNEARVLAKLEHFAIVPIYDYGEENGFPFLSMRYMQQGSLAAQLTPGPLPISVIARVLHRVAEALDKAHSQGIIHRDIKPSNILFDAQGNAYLSDFGIAKLRESQQNLTTEAIVGTPAYMSPEQVDGSKKIDGRSDIYSLGILLFEMMTGQTPYRSQQSHIQQMMAHILTPTPSILTVRPDLPEAFVPIVAKAMNKEPDNRYANARGLAEDFLKTAVLTRHLSPLHEDSWPGLAAANPLPIHLQHELDSDQADVRAEAARKLEALLYTPNSSLLIPALIALAKLSKDDDSHVARRATTHLDNFYHHNDPSTNKISTPPTIQTTEPSEITGITTKTNQSTDKSVRPLQHWLQFASRPIMLDDFWVSIIVIFILSVLIVVLVYALLKPPDTFTGSLSPPSNASTEEELFAAQLTRTASPMATQTAWRLTADASASQSTRLAEQNTRAADKATAIAQQLASATAHAQATGTTTAMRANINTILAQVRPNHYLVGDHQLEHVEDDFVSTYLDETIYLQDFVAEAQFFNPFGADYHNWDIGFFFRHNPDDNHRQWRVIISTDGEGNGYWNLDFFYNNERVEGYSMNGRLDSGVLDTKEGGYNQLTLIAQGHTGYLLVNGYAISQLNLDSFRDGPGHIQTGTGFYAGHEINGYSTHVQEFVIRSANPADILGIKQKVTATAVADSATATVTAGNNMALSIIRAANSPSIYYKETDTLIHQDDDFIEAYTASVDVKNFITEAIFSNPYLPTTRNWDYGFIFRQNTQSHDSYHLIIQSNNKWTLNLRQNGGQITISSGELGHLDTTAYGRNKLLLIAKDWQGYFYLNDQFVAVLDLSGRTVEGEVALATGFYAGSEISGKQTDFFEFGVWPIN